ncbi:LysR family transcriptional regulator [Actinocatenispora rupis]|uniref:LysR family transcriptional regulator n=1 Tax=Actinocatenispora rupis TaxID=519421 RepID=A0A8J3NCF5_9ACTN|nr:LysR family transcriptional regulator [Actinocatenispora rupis]GID11840.1 LysR family transcriptional regulator [Actinocatenispora rupis]
MGHVDIQVLRWFRAVADGATVTRTAADAHVTQPALSRALGRLEREVGTPLLHRAGRGLRLTPAGRVFAEHAAATLDRYDAGLRATAEVVDPDRGVVPLAFLHTFGTWLVPPLVHGYLAARPRVRFELNQHGEQAILSALLSGGVDLIITSGDPDHPDVRWRRLLVEPLRLAVPPGHRLAHRTRVRLADVADDPFVVLRPGYGLRDTTEDLCRAAGFVPRIGFEGEEVETLRGLVTAGLGVALLPVPQTATFPPSQALPAAPHLRVSDVDASRDVGLAWLRGRVLPASSAGFRDHVLRSVRDVAPPGYR